MAAKSIKGHLSIERLLSPNTLSALVNLRRLSSSLQHISISSARLHAHRTPPHLCNSDPHLFQLPRCRLAMLRQIPQHFKGQEGGELFMMLNRLLLVLLCNTSSWFFVQSSVPFALIFFIGIWMGTGALANHISAPYSVLGAGRILRLKTQCLRTISSSTIYAPDSSSMVLLYWASH